MKTYYAFSVQPSDFTLGTQACAFLFGNIYLGLTLCIRTNLLWLFLFQWNVLLLYHKSLNLSSKLNPYFLTSFITNPKFTQPFTTTHNFHGA
jgi:hypothetical protein